MWKKDSDGASVIPTMGRNNCGSKCVIRAHVKDNKITKISTETAKEVTDRPPLTACVRGMNYHKSFINDQRLLYPLKRVGKRGEGKFVEISWQEAIDTIYSEWVRIRDTYGVGSRYVNYATGVDALVSGRNMVKRLLSLDGGFLDYYNSYSTACVNYTTPYLYGTTLTGSSSDTLLDAKLIVLWGHNPSETKFGAHTNYYLKKAKEKGIPIIVIDPRKSDTTNDLNAKWIPIRPATDSALTDSLCYIIYTKNLHNDDFINKFTIGFSEETMPEDVDKSLNYFDYLLGKKDNTPKTPSWASKITGIPEDVIYQLALDIAAAKPCAIIPGYGPQRHQNGEQGTRGIIALAALTGNIGISGGWAAGSGYVPSNPMPYIPSVVNPFKGKIPSFLWTDGITHGSTMTKLDGVEGLEQLPSDIKMIFNLAGNILINQHGDINKTKEILSDTSKCEFIVCSDLFMTPSAKFADILLPGTSMFEGENIALPWNSGDFFGFHNKVMEPLGQCRFEYDWLVELSEKLGLKAEFTQSNDTTSSWLEYCYNQLKEKNALMPSYQDFKQDGIYKYPEQKNIVAFKKQIEDFANNKFPTESGKIEIFSKRIHSGQFKEFVPAIPMYIPAQEGHEDTLIKEYPLQLIGWHTKRRCHSTHDNNLELHKVDPQLLWINKQDANQRQLADGEMVEVYNHRGKIIIPIKITDRIVSGVVALSQGAWHNTDNDNNDIAGSINVLTSHIPSPLAKGNSQHTNLVQIGKLPDTKV